VAATDYGTRGSQKDKKVIPFGDLNLTLYRRTDVEKSSWFMRVHINRMARLKLLLRKSRSWRRQIDGISEKQVA
jgi:hypothetical protein